MLWAVFGSGSLADKFKVFRKRAGKSSKDLMVENGAPSSNRPANQLCGSDSTGTVTVTFSFKVSFSVRLASFFCARRSAFMRCFSSLFISFWRFWNVVGMGSPLLGADNAANG
jgi:hypothetical protein